MILTFDQATNKTGWCYMPDGTPQQYGEIDLSEIKDTQQRMSKMKSEIWNLYNKLQPIIVGLEDTTLRTINYKKGNTIIIKPLNVEVFKTLTKQLGIIENNMFEKEIEVIAVLPSEWRKTCGIKGKEREIQKENAIKFVKEKFNIDVNDNIAEAICIAWHIHKKVLKLK